MLLLHILIVELPIRFLPLSYLLLLQVQIHQQYGLYHMTVVFGVEGNEANASFGEKYSELQEKLKNIFPVIPQKQELLRAYTEIKIGDEFVPAQGLMVTSNQKDHLKAALHLLEDVGYKFAEPVKTVFTKIDSLGTDKTRT